MSSSERLEDFVDALQPRLTGDLRVDAMTRALYATDASLYQIQPIGVLIPQHVDDVQAALEAAKQFAIPVLPRGGGSSLAGQTVGAALVIDFTKHLNAVLEINAEERWARVQPGLVLDHFNAALSTHGLMMGPDPASSNRATLGGMVGNNATGTHSILYGNVIQHVRSIGGFLADSTPITFGPLNEAAWTTKTKLDGTEGELYRKLDRLLHQQGAIIEQDTPGHWRRSSGYRLEYLLNGHAPERNMAQMLCGSEGTLAVSTEINLSLVPRPRKTVLGVVHFRTRSESLRAVTKILVTQPSAVELFDGVAIEQTRRSPGFAPRLTFIDGSPGAVLITEYYGDTEQELKARLDDLEHLGIGYTMVRATTPEQIHNVWSVRKEGLGLIMGVRGDYKPVAVIEDASVPVEHLADYIDDLDRLLESTKTSAVFYAHASAGCLHVRPFLNTKMANEVEKLREISFGSMELVKKYGGSISSEHGDGIVRGWLNEYFLGHDLCNTYRDLKRIFDPNNLLNPEKIVDTPSITEHLRLGPTYETIPVLEELDWTEEGGFAQAVEMCNGNGACRKLESGTMCPSFMATREEEHSTRGRANALRAVLSGTLPPEEFTGSRMYEVMDLCIQCKGCKTECPSHVDMAKLKMEWQHKYWQDHGISRRAQFIADQPMLARRFNGGVRASMVNWANKRKPLRKIVERTLGFTSKRELPEFASEPFSTWFAKQNWSTDGKPVVLFADTFSNYFHPEIARAAAEFLHHTGHHVIVPNVQACCGRPLLSKGLITEAQEQALQTIDLLFEYVEQDLPIVGLEPSCILTFGDEFLSLLPGDLRAKRLAQSTLMFEQYVAQLADEGHLDDVAWKSDGGKVLLHGHCHQKALIGIASAERCLSLPGYTVETINSSCCGMAGAFGYEAEHYDISLAMAERNMAPAVRAASEDTIIAAAGTSCRAQIQDTATRHALHPAEVLRNALGKT